MQHFPQGIIKSKLIPLLLKMLAFNLINNGSNDMKLPDFVID